MSEEWRRGRREEGVPRVSLERGGSIRGRFKQQCSPMVDLSARKKLGLVHIETERGVGPGPRKASRLALWPA